MADLQMLFEIQDQSSFMKIKKQQGFRLIGCKIAGFQIITAHIEHMISYF